MSIKHAVLGLLAEHPMHGYAVRAELERRLGDVVELGAGRVYAVLARLEEEGLASGVRERHGRRCRKVWAPSDAGRRELARWMQEEPSSDGLSELVVRLAAAGSDAGACAEVLRAWERHERRMLVAWRRMPVPGGGLAALARRLAVEAGLRRGRAVLQALELCRDVLARHDRGASLAEVLRDLERSRTDE